MMSYQARSDGLVAVAIDSNIWNLLFDLDLNLATELPTDRFRLFIPREVEIEIAAIPAQPNKAALTSYIRRQISEGNVQTLWRFGFSTGGKGPERHGGFNLGTWISPVESAFYEKVRAKYLLGKPETRSQLTRNEADASLAASSFSSIVLTLDLRRAGPLSMARKLGGKVLDMRPFRDLGTPLASYILECHFTP